MEALATLGRILSVEMNAAAENPLGCELVAAIRALRQRDLRPAGRRLRALAGARRRALYDRCLDELPADGADRPLDTDIAAAEDVIAATSRLGGLEKSHGQLRLS